MAERSLPDAFIAALHALSVWLTTSQVPHAMIGGVAVSLIANPRATQDIDVVIWLEEAEWETLLSDGKAMDSSRVSAMCWNSRSSRASFFCGTPAVR